MTYVRVGGGVSRRSVMRRAALLWTAAGLAMAGPVSQGLADTKTYTGATDNSWDTDSNWNTPGKPSAADDAVFPALLPATGRFVTLTAGETANSISLSDYYSLRGGSLALTTGAVSVAGGNTLVGGGFAFEPVTVGLNSASISTQLTGGGGLAKSGDGTLYLSVGFPTGSSTYTGNVSITAGRLGINSDGALGASSNVIALNKGILGVYDSAALSRSITVDNNGGTIDVVTNPNVTNRQVILTGAGFSTASAGSTAATLTKTGRGNLIIGSANGYTGQLVLATNGGTTTLGGASGAAATPNYGSLNAAAGVTINPYATLLVDNRNSYGSLTGTASVAGLSNTNRFADNIPVTLNGGVLTLQAADVANSISETFGTITANQGRSTLNANSSGTTGNGGNIIISNLVVNTGAAVSFNGSTTIGTAGNTGRYILNQINGVAPTAGVYNLGGWATVSSFDFATYSAPAGTAPNYTSGGVGVATYVAGVASAAPGNNTGFATATNTRLDAGTGATTFTLASGNTTTGAIKFNGGQTIALNYTNTGDILNIESGGIISSDNNNTRTISATAGFGKLTAGGTQTSGTASLYFYVNQGTTTVNASITDNGSVPVSVVKMYGGTVTLATANPYSGGTYQNGNGGGNLTGSVAGSFGSGPVFATSGGTITLGAQGATSNTTATRTYDIINTAAINVQNLAGGGLLAGQTIHVGPQSFIILSGTTSANALKGSVPGAGNTQNLFLDEGAIVATNAISNLTATFQTSLGAATGSAPKYWLGFNGNITEGITVGTGTPWIGLSTTNAARVYVGSNSTTTNTITANSDFAIQGFNNNNTYQTFTLGNAAGTANAVRIVPAAGLTAVKVNLIGNVTFANDQSTYQGVTFIATPGSTISLSAATAVGNLLGGSGNATAANTASLVMQQGSVLDIGGTVVSNAINGPVTFEPGSTLRLDDNNPNGQLGGTGTLNFQPGSVIMFQASSSTNPLAAFQGAQLPAAGSTLPSGVIIRMNGNTFQPAAGVNQYGLIGVSGVNNANSALVTAGSSSVKIAPDTIFEISTSTATNPTPINTITRATGDPAVDNVFISGGVIAATSNNNTGSTLSQGGGRIIVGPNGLTLVGLGLQPSIVNSATPNALFLNEDFDLPVSGRTITVGSTSTILGVNRTGSEVFLNAAGSRSVAGGVLAVTANSQVIQNVAHSIPDLATVNLAAGSSLLLNNASVETVGGLSGSGVVVSNQATPTLQIGFGDQSSQFDGVLSGVSATIAPFATNQFNVNKIGTGTLTLTGASTVTGTFNQVGGTTRFTQASGSGVFTTYQLIRGTLALDNSTNAVSNRLGNGKAVNFGGGNLQILGNASTPVTETIGTTSVSLGGTSIIDLTSPGAGVTLTTGTTAFPGKSISTVVLRGDLGNAAKFTVTTPGITGTYAAGQGTTGVRADVLHDNSATSDGTGLAFTTYDPTNGFRRLTSNEYSPLAVAAQTAGTPASVNARLTSNLTLNYPLSPVAGQQAPIGSNGQMQSLTLVGASLTQAAVASNQGGATLLNVSSGGILSEAGAGSTVTAPFITGGGVLSLTAIGDLAVNALLINGNSFVKAGPGAVNLGTGALNFADGGNFSLNAGTVKLGPGSDTFTNPLFKSALFVNGTTAVGGRNMWLNSGTLDLNGNSLIVGQFSASNAGVNPTQITGGNVVNTGGVADLSTNGSQPFAGSISGIRNFTKYGGNNTQTLYGAVTLSGDFYVRGATVNLVNGGQVVGAQNVILNVGSLALNNVDSMNFNQATDYSGPVVASRIPSTAAVQMRGGVLQFRSAPGIIDSQTFGNTGSGTTGLTLALGANQIDAQANANSSSNVTIANLVRDPAAQSFVNFTGSNTGNSGEGYQVSHIYLTQFNGSAFDSSPTLLSGIVGPWAVVNGSNWATYISSTSAGATSGTTGKGISNLGNTNATAAINNGFAGYSASAFNAATSGVASTTAADNINSTGGSEAAGVTARTIGTLRSSNGTTATTFTFNSGEVLTLAGGGLLTDTNAVTTLTGGTVTSTYKPTGANASAPSELYVWTNQNTTTIASAIADNAAGGGAGAVSLIKAGPATLTLSGVNSYTGGTVVSQGTLTLSTAGVNGTTTVAVPGSLTINGTNIGATNAATTVVNATTADQIARNAVVTMNGGNATLNLQSAAASATTTILGGLVFNNIGGGATAPVVSISTLNTAAGGGTLVVNGNITAVNDNLANVPTINQSIGGTALVTPVAVLDLGGAVRTIDTTGQSFLGLNIQAAVANGGILKTGSGTLGLGVTNGNLVGGASTSTLTGGITINGGVVRADSVGALGASGAGGNNVTVNAGGILASAVAGNVTGNITLNGGTIQGIANVTPVFTGNVSVNDNSTIAQQDYFYSGQVNRNLTLSGPVTVAAGKTLSIIAAPYAGSTGTVTLANAANDFTALGATLAIGPNAIVRPDTGATPLSVGSAINGAKVVMTGGQLNFQISGLSAQVATSTIAVNNPLFVSGSALINVDRGSSTTATANTVQFGELTLGAPGVNTVLSVTAGNSYTVAFGGGVAGGGITLVDGTNTALNSSVTFTIPNLKGAPASFTKYNAAQLNVAGWDSTLTGSNAPITIANGVLNSTATSGTAISGGKLTTAAGILTNTVTGTGIYGTLRNSSGTTNVVTYAPSSITHEGLIQAATGTMNFGGKFIDTGAVAPNSSPFSATFSERFFNGNVTDAALTLHTGSNYLNGITPVSTGTLASQRLSFESRSLQSRARDNSQTNGTGALYQGSFTVGGSSGIPAGPVSFGLASDDGSALYIDLNNSGTFDSTELIIDNRGGHGVQAYVNTTPALAAGTYNFAVSYYNSAGATNFGALELRYFPGTLGAGVSPNTTASQLVSGFQPVPYGNQYIVAPSGAKMAGTLQVDAGATLIAGAFTADTATIASGGTLQIDASSTGASTLQILYMNGTTAGAAGAGTLDIATGKTLTVASGYGVGAVANAVLVKSGAGTLLVNASGGAGFSGTLNITGGTIGGKGTIAGQMTVATGATAAPGDGPGPGVLTVTGATTLATGATFAVDIGGPTPGNGAGKYDQMNVTASTGTPLAINNSTLALSASGGYNSPSTSGVIYYILTQGGTNQLSATTDLFLDPVTLQPVAEGQTINFADGSGSTAQITYLADYNVLTGVGSLSGTGNDVAIYNVNVVPEPATLAAAGLAAAGLLLRRRRRA